MEPLSLLFLLPQTLLFAGEHIPKVRTSPARCSCPFLLAGVVRRFRDDDDSRGRASAAHAATSATGYLRQSLDSLAAAERAGTVVHGGDLAHWTQKDQEGEQEAEG